MRRFVPLAVVAVVVVLAPGLSASMSAPRGQKKPDVAEVLSSAAAYLDDYAREFTGLMADEAYVQRASSGGITVQDRKIEAGVFLLSYGDTRFTGFRDVFVVNASTLQHDKGQMERLFSTAPGQAVATAKQVSDASASANFSTVAKEFNIPTFALQFLTRANQGHSTFKIDGTKTVDGVTVVTLHFAETVKPRLIATRDAAAATGRFWVDADTGRVRQSELMLTSGGVDIKVGVVYGPQAKLAFWVPISMDEHYQGPAGANVMGGTGVTMADTQSFAGAGTSSAAEAHQGVDSHAGYSNYRVVDVDLKQIR